MGRNATLILATLIAFIAVQLINRRRHARKPLISRMSEQLSRANLSEPVESLIDDVEEALKEIRKRVRQ